VKFWPPLVTPSGEEPIATGGWPFCDDKIADCNFARLLAVAGGSGAWRSAGWAYRLVDLQVLAPRLNSAALAAAEGSQLE
jgi:hypothetical protein